MDDFETTTLVDAVAKMLVDADIVMSGKYAFVGRSSSGGSSGGGLDGLVFGRLDGRDVAVIVITSDDMDRYHAKAQCEMRAAVAHWNILATMTESELELDRNRDLVIDHRVLRVAGNERRAVVRAFGCAFDFSDLTMQKFSRSYGGWIRIRFDPIARFIS